MEDLARDKVAGRKNSLPRVIDDTTYFIEHPELVAERIVRFATLVGKENVIACTDCGLRHLPDASLALDETLRACGGRPIGDRRAVEVSSRRPSSRTGRLG
jgi:methionine synthase II (cobalamin-independent)